MTQAATPAPQQVLMYSTADVMVTGAGMSSQDTHRQHRYYVQDCNCLYAQPDMMKQFKTHNFIWVGTAVPYAFVITAEYDVWRGDTTASYQDANCLLKYISTTVLGYSTEPQPCTQAASLSTT